MYRIVCVQHVKYQGEHAIKLVQLHKLFGCSGNSAWPKRNYWQGIFGKTNNITVFGWIIVPGSASFQPFLLLRTLAVVLYTIATLSRTLSERAVFTGSAQVSTPVQLATASLLTARVGYLALNHAGFNMQLLFICLTLTAAIPVTLGSCSQCHTA